MLTPGATTKMKTLVAATLLALCLLPATTQAGATFDEALPSFTQANNYKMVFNSGTTSSAAANNTKRPVATNNAGHSPFENATLNMRVVNVEPCGVIAAHIHPRATEHLYMMKGSVEVGMFVESGNAVYVTPKEGEGVVIPQGTVHYVRNVGCRVSQYVVALDDPNPGVLFVGQALVGFPRSVIDNAFDGKFPMASKGNQYLLSKPYCNCK